MAGVADDTLAGLIQFNNMNNADLDVTDLLNKAKWLSVAFAMEASNGTNHSYLKEVLEPGVGFRDINTGITNAAGEEEEIDVLLKLLDASFDRDKAQAMKFRKGMEEFMAKMGVKSLKEALFNAEKQAINGTNNAAAGFNGLADTLSAVSHGMVIDHGGVAADLQTSVYLVVEGEDDVAIIAGNDGMFEVGDIIEQKIVTNAATNEGYTGLMQSILGWIAVQIGSVFSAARIANIDDTATLTDDVITAAVALFPADKQPTRILMNRKANMQLQQSRTATNPTGKEAPFPTEVHNIPIALTDAIENTEAVLT